MLTNQPLRLYVNPVKQFLYLLISVAFVAGGVFMLQDPKVQANPSKAIWAYVAIGLFGLGAIVFLVMVVRYVILRHPVLQIDAQGWSYSPPLNRGKQAITWDNIGAIALCQQTLPRGGSVYYLVLHARDPHRLPHPRARAFAASVSPALAGAAMSIPLNALFMRVTFAKSKQLLEHIASSSVQEIQYYGVRVVTEMQFI